PTSTRLPYTTLFRSARFDALAERRGTPQQIDEVRASRLRVPPQRLPGVEGCDGRDDRVTDAEGIETLREGGHPRRASGGGLEMDLRTVEGAPAEGAVRGAEAGRTG